jgi:hypothetical protein
MLLSAAEIEDSKEREKKKKSYFIKNGIELFSPSCQPSTRDLYKSVGQYQTMVLSEGNLPVSIFAKKVTNRYRQVRKKNLRMLLFL